MCVRLSVHSSASYNKCWGFILLVRQLLHRINDYSWRTTASCAEDGCWSVVNFILYQLSLQCTQISSDEKSALSDNVLANKCSIASYGSLSFPSAFRILYRIKNSHFVQIIKIKILCSVK